MAFTVTPTSGAGPYLYEAEFANKENINGSLYTIHFYSATTEGSCPSPRFSGVDQTNIAQALVNDGTYLQSGSNVASGSCRVVNLVIRTANTGDVVVNSTVSINNL